MIPTTIPCRPPRCSRRFLSPAIVDPESLRLDAPLPQMQRNGVGLVHGRVRLRPVRSHNRKHHHHCPPETAGPELPRPQGGGRTSATSHKPSDTIGLTLGTKHTKHTNCVA